MHVILAEQSLRTVVTERHRRAQAYDHAAGFAVAPRWQRAASPSWRSRLSGGSR